MSTHFSNTVQLRQLNLSPTSNSNDDSVVSTASSVSDSDLEDDEIYTTEKYSSATAAIANVDIEANVKPTCPSTVSHIVNTLSAAGTFCGLGLVITGGMGMTINKPIDNAAENMAMVLSGGALLVGSWIGTVIYANNQTV